MFRRLCQSSTSLSLNQLGGYFANLWTSPPASIKALWQEKVYLNGCRYKFFNTDFLWLVCPGVTEHGMSFLFLSLNMFLKSHLQEEENESAGRRLVVYIGFGFFSSNFAIHLWNYLNADDPCTWWKLCQSRQWLYWSGFDV